MNIVEIIVSFVSGGLMSLIIWFLTTKLLSPKLILSPKIARTHIKDENKCHYYLKIQNGSKSRDIYDIACYIRFHFSDDSFYSQTIPTIPLLRVKDENNSHKYERKIEMKNINLNAVSKATQLKYNVADNQINIDTFFEMEKDKGYIEFVVVCYDAFSGAKRCVLSKEFHNDDINNGYFPLGKMFVEEEPNPRASTECHADSYH